LSLEGKPTESGPQTKTRKKREKRTVNPDVDVYTKTVNHPKTLRKTRKNKNPLKTKTEI